MPRQVGFPEEHPCRRPPPSTLFPCRAWSCRRTRPLFCRSEAPVHEGLAPIELASIVELGEERAPQIQPHVLFFPFAKSSPTRWATWEFRRHITPARSGPEHP